MGLTPTQRQIIAKARSLAGAPLDDATCAYLVAVIALDLGWYDDFGDLSLGPRLNVPDFFAGSASDFDATGLDFYGLFERLVALQPAAETYFACLAHLHARRLKYGSILQHQPLPTMDQVGPRALLQYGKLEPDALAAFLFWRKWVFDIDNRAGQETGYLFEPIIAAALGGAPASARRSPVKRRTNPTKGRQVDCIREADGVKLAYEIKLRVTIAASGQGRFKEELEFPDDCKASGYVPVLVVLAQLKRTSLRRCASVSSLLVARHISAMMLGRTFRAKLATRWGLFLRSTSVSRWSTCSPSSPRTSRLYQSFDSGWRRACLRLTWPVALLACPVHPTPQPSVMRMVTTTDKTR